MKIRTLFLALSCALALAACAASPAAPRPEAPVLDEAGMDPVASGDGGGTMGSGN